jgi:hypothetical protein
MSLAMWSMESWRDVALLHFKPFEYANARRGVVKNDLGDFVVTERPQRDTDIVDDTVEVL